MKTLRPFTTLVMTAVTFLTVPDALRAAEPISISETQADAQVSGTLPNSRAGLMTLGSLGGLNETTIGALPSVGLSGNFGDNYWREDFYTLDAFLPWNVNPGTDYFFGEIGLSLTEQGRAVGNIGGGYAYYLANIDRLMRMGSYFTVDGQYEKTRAAWSLRAESLGKYVDVLSGIQIVTTDSDDIVGRGLTGQEGFSGNNYLLEGLIVRETAFHNADIELGGPLPYLGDYGISAYAKGYYMMNTQADLDSLGFGFRSEWSITEDVIFNVNYTKDDIFDHSTWFNIAFSTPDGAPRNFLRPISTRERFSKRVHRTGRVPTKVRQRQFSTPLLNPKTGSPYVFAHLDPDATSNGSGTFENPYNNIDAMVAANEAGGGINAFYIQPRMDGTSTNLTLLAPPERPLALRPNQLLLGSTIDQTIDVVSSVFTPSNTYTIPALDAGLAAPVLMNGSANPNAIVYASQGNLISGLTFDGGGVHDGVRLHSYDMNMGLPMGANPMGDGFGRDLHIRNNTFQNTVVGVNANDLSDGMPDPLCTLLGHSTVWNNTFDSNGTAYDITINAANNDGPGGTDPFDGLQLTLSILNNTISNNVNGGHVTANGVDPTMPPGNNYARVDLIGNEDADGSGTLDGDEDLDRDGMLTQRDLDGDGIPDPVFAGNTSDGNTNHGFAFFANDGGQIYLQAGALPDFEQPDPANPVFFNTFSGDGGDGLHLEANSTNANGVSSFIGGTIIANNFSNPGSGGDGLGIDATGEAMNFNATPSFIDFGQTAQFEGAADTDGDGIIENTIDSTTRNAGVGIAEFDGLQAYSGVIRGNLFDRRTSGNDGAEFNITNSSADFDFINNTFIADQTGNAAAGAGINANLIAGSSPNLYQNSQLVMSVGSTVQGTGNVFTNNGDAGLIFSTEGFVGSPARQQDRSFLSVQNNLFENTFDNGISTNVSPDGAGVFVRRSGASLLTAVIGDGIANNQTNGNMFIGNDVGVQVVGAGSEQSVLNNFSASMVYIDDNMFDENGNGIQYDLTADAVMQTFVVTNSITNSTGDAIQINSSNNSSLGMPVQATNGEDLNFDGVLQPWEDTDFDGTLQGSGPTVLSSVFDSNFIQGFGDDGIDITHTFQAFHDVRISGRQLDRFGNQIRTIIDGQGAGDNGIELLSSGSHVVQNNPGTNLWTIQGVDIFDVGTDGININTQSGQNTFIIGSPEATGNPFGGQYVRVQGSGDDGLDVLSEGVTFDNFFINNFATTMNGDDGAAFFQDGLADVAVNITSSVFNENEGNGLQADIRSDSESVDGNFTAVYNIGTEDTTSNGSGFNEDNDGVKGTINVAGFSFMDEDVTDTGTLGGGNVDLNGNGILDFGEDVTQTGGVIPGVAGNTFSNNNEQGFFFQTLADFASGRELAGDITLLDGTDPLDPRNTQGGNENGGDTWPSPIFDGETEAFIFANAATTNVQNRTVLNFVNNQVTDNGSRAGNLVDGMVLQIGTNTQQIAWIDGNLFGGNELDDLRTQVVVSANPQNSATLGNPNRTRFEYDPVAFLDIAMGQNYTTGPGVPPTIDPAFDAPQGPSTLLNPNGMNVGNFGESVFINIDGEGTALFGRTELGLFTNSDVVKPADRQAIGFFTFYDSTGTGANLTPFGNVGNANTFTQSFTFSGAGTLFDTFNTTGALIRPSFDTLNFSAAPFLIR